MTDAMKPLIYAASEGPLSRAQAEEAFEIIFEGNATPAQLGGFLMAMRARGEISLLSRIAHPNLAIITNTSGSHVGRLGSFEEVYKAKCEIVAEELGVRMGDIVFRHGGTV